MNRKIIVLQKMFGLNGGGVETIITNLYEKLGSNEYRFDYALDVNEQPEQLDSRIYAMGSKRFCYGLWTHKAPIIKGRIKRYIILARKLKETLRNYNYDIIHLNGSVLDNVVGAIVARQKKVPIIVSHAHINNEISTKEKKYLLIINYLLKQILALNVDYCLAVTRHAAEWYYPKTYIKAERVIYLKNGIDASKYRFDETIRSKVRDELGIDKDTFLIGNVARFTHQKNQEFLVEVFRQLTIMFPSKKIKLIFVGNDKNSELVRMLLDKYNLNQNVIIYGYCSNIPNILQALDLFVLPSRWEGLGISAIEAQAAGLKTMCSLGVPREAGITDLFEQLDLNDGAEVWAKAIYKNMIPYKRNDMYQCIVEAGYDLESSARKLDKLYKDALKKKNII